MASEKQLPPNDVMTTHFEVASPSTGVNERLTISEIMLSQDEGSSYKEQARNERTSLLGGQEHILVYKRRWLMLLIFSLNTAMNGCLFMAISPINDIVRVYYSIRSVVVEWLSNMCVIAYVALALPATYMMSRWGIRPLMMCASCCNFIATALHYAGYQNDRFHLVLIGQGFTAIAYSTILQMPGKLSSLWFPDHERATSTSIGVVMNLLGVAVGFLQPSMMVGASKNKRDIETDLKTFYITQMIASGLILLITLFYKEKPPTPPNAAQQAGPSLDFLESLKLLWQNKHFIFLSQSYAIYFALFVAIFVLVNPLVTDKFEIGFEDEIGMMGFWNNMVAIVAFLIIGRLLDKYKKYQLFAVLLNFVSMLVWLSFVVILTSLDNFTAIYGIFLALGVCFVPYFAVGIEQAAEMTYPVSEETSSSIILILGNVYAFVFIFLFGVLTQMGYVRTVGYSMVGLYFVATVMALLAKTDLKRSVAEKTPFSSPPETRRRSDSLKRRVVGKNGDS